MIDEQKKMNAIIDELIRTHKDYTPLEIFQLLSPEFLFENPIYQTLEAIFRRVRMARAEQDKKKGLWNRKKTNYTHYYR